MRKRRHYLRWTGLSPELRFPAIGFLLWRNVGRRWQICGTLFFGERILIGTAAPIQPPAPAKASFIGAGAFLRGTGLSPELWLPVIVLLLWRNVGRSWEIYGTLFFGERILIGAAARIRTSAPAKPILIGAGAFLRGTGLSPELRFPVIDFLRWRNVGRSWQICGTLFIGERILVGADAPSQASAPTKPHKHKKPPVSGRPTKLTTNP